MTIIVENAGLSDRGLVRKENESLRRGLLGKKAERLPSDSQQLSLQILSQMLGDDAAEEDATGLAQPTQDVRPHTRRKPTGRKPLPEHLPIVRIEFIPNEVKLQLTLRSYTDEVRESTIKSIRRITKGLGEAAGLPEDLLPVVSVKDEFTPATYNDPDLVNRLAGTLAGWIGGWA